MPLIIAVTDFSAISLNATNYACQLALTHNTRVVVLHSILLPLMFSDVPMPSSLVSDVEFDAQNQMTTLISNLSRSYPGLQVTGEVVNEEVVGALDRYTQEIAKPWMIVIGNGTDDGDLPWLDSTMISAFRRSQYPVLAVPMGISYKPVHRICFAFDNKHTGNNTALQQLKEISLHLNAELHVLYASPDVPNQDNTPFIDENAIKVLQPAHPNFHVEYETTIENAIRELMKNNDIDWLVVLPRKHSFFAGMFHKSHTKAIIQLSPIPILALHEEEEPVV